jgi:AraC-like DNA-binding protein
VAKVQFLTSWTQTKTVFFLAKSSILTVNFYCHLLFFLYFCAQKNAKTMKKTILDYLDRINERGITILDNITALPHYDEPHKTTGFILCINNKGTLEVDYDIRLRTAHPRQVAFIYPHHIISAQKSSPDYDSTIVAVSAPFLYELSAHPIYKNRLVFETFPTFDLSEEQYDQVHRMIDAMRIVENSGMPTWREFMVEMFYILVQLLQYYFLQTNPNYSKGPTRKTDKFRDALFKHFRSQREVSFYADQLCLSNKHFSTVIKKETGHSPGFWIRKRVIAEAKLLLRTSPDLNIQDISNELNFEDQATFSRYFKRETGMTPSEYRHSLTHWD